MPSLREAIQSYLARRHVRQWGMIGPVLVLVFCLPLLRPLRHPTPQEVSQDEAARLATVQAIVERGTLSVQDVRHVHTDRLIRGVDGRLYADQPPVFAALLSVAYFCIKTVGFTFAKAPILVPYLLTLIGVTIPVTVAAGLLYRMGRLFELPRPWRATLAVGCIVGSGLISYATVLNAHAPAATLVLCAAACLIHLATSGRPANAGGWLVLAGVFASVAAVIDSGAIAFMLLLPLVVLAMRWRAVMRIGGVLLYVVGCTPALLLHATLVMPITGDLSMGRTSHPELAVGSEILAAETIAPTSSTSTEHAISLPSDSNEAFDDEDADPFWLSTGHTIGRLLAAMFGTHGLLSHFPIALLGMIGIAAVMHRHWPASTKTLAAMTLIAALAILAYFATMRLDPQEPMFASRRFIVFLPLMLYWSGAWLRRARGAVAWGVVGSLMAFSVAVSLIGATFPFPRDGYSEYTVTGAARQLVAPKHPQPAREALAGG